MSQWDQNIEGNHLKIASHEGSTMRVLAGPGTGKSYALQRKVMRLLEAGKNPTRILALTFTNVAADALKKDLQALGVAGADLVRARTLHSLCFEILMKEQVLQITNRIPRPLADFETNILLEDLKDEFGGKRETEKLLLAYESAFARQQQDIPGVINSAIDATFRERLLRWLKLHKAILIGELVPLTYDYLKNNPTTPELSHYDFILVDEYQDLNKAEQALIDLLSKNSELLVMGDEDQSIYSFKHAHPEGIIEFPTTHTPLADVGLQICRRCPKKVVNLANELMGYLLGTHPKKLEAYPENKEGVVHAVQWKTLEDETRGLAKLIKKMTSDSTYGIKPEEILVLSPRRQIGYALRDELQNNYSINAHTFFQEEALDDLKAQKAYSLLNYIAYPNDRIALRALLAIPTVLPATYEKLLVKAEELNKTVRDIILELKAGTLQISGTTEIIRRFDEIEKIKEELKTKKATEIILALFDPNDPEGIEVILSIISILNITEEDEIKKVFNRIQDRIRSPEVSEEAGFVKIMSLHKSKGLSSRVVFILGCVAGLLPFIKDEAKLIAENKNSELEKLKAEAKRLFFVAITRSKEYLILSSFREIDFARAMKFGVKIRSGNRGSLAQTQSSPFFSEVSKHLPQVTSGPELLQAFQIEE